MIVLVVPGDPHVRSDRKGWAPTSEAPQETFERHFAALCSGDRDALVADDADDALVLNVTGEYRGKPEIRALFERIDQNLPQASFEKKITACAGDVLLLHWTVDSSLNTVPDGIDTFVFADGQIQSLRSSAP